MSVLWTLAGLLYTFLLPLATANTEIRNFDASPERVLASPSAILNNSRLAVLNSTYRESTFLVSPAALRTPLSSVCNGLRDQSHCAHEIWLKLDLEDPAWIKYAKFTIRISWPAFYPTDFDITLFSPVQLAEHFHSIQDSSEESRRSLSGRSLTRVKHARIRLVDTGVRSPTLSADLQSTELVPFNLILEPLLLNVLPATLLPTIMFLIPTIVGMVIALPFVFRYLTKVATQARAELCTQSKKTD